MSASGTSKRRSSRVRVQRWGPSRRRPRRGRGSRARGCRWGRPSCPDITAGPSAVSVSVSSGQPRYVPLDSEMRPVVPSPVNTGTDPPPPGPFSLSRFPSLSLSHTLSSLACAALCIDHSFCRRRPDLPLVDDHVRSPGVGWHLDREPRHTRDPNPIRRFAIALVHTSQRGEDGT